MNVRRLYLLFLLCLTLGVTSAGAGVRGDDSLVVFRFKVHRDIFLADYLENREQMTRMGRFIQSNREKIMRGELPVFVDGYSVSMATEKENVALSRVRSSHVKSYMVMRYGLVENDFRTTNHAQPYDSVGEAVTVSFTVPAMTPHTTAKIIEDRAITSATVIARLGDTTTTRKTELEQPDPSKIEVSPLQIWADGNVLNELVFENRDTYALLEKSAYYVSLSANFNNAKTANLLIEPLFDVHSIYRRKVDVQAAFGYFLKNNVAVGLYAGYTMADTRVDVTSDLLQLLIGSRQYETNNASTGFTVGAFTKTFIPLEYRHRVFMVNEASLFYEQVRSISRNVYDRGAMLSKVYQTTYRGGVKLSLGVLMFLRDNLSLDFNISPVAAMYQYNKVLNNETLSGAFAGGGLNTIVLPIDLKFSLSYYFGLDYRKNRQHVKTIHDNLDK